MMIIIDISISEFKKLESEINTWYHDRYKDKNVIVHYMPNFIYFAINKGFNKYLFFDKIHNNGTFSDWYNYDIDRFSNTI